MAARSGAAPARRPRDRREQIVAAAATLFRDQGFSRTRIEDIGAAVGMTGPAVYRHFPSKQALLEALMGRAMERARADIALARAARSPRETLERLVRHAAVQAVDESALVGVAGRELRNLPDDARRRLGRDQRAILAAWYETVSSLRPDLEPEAVRVAVRGAIALLHSAPRSRPPAREALIDQLARMALAALLAR